MGSIRDCLAQEIGYVGPECAFGFDNSKPNGGSASQWGILDFPEGWPIAPPNPIACTSNPGGANDVIAYLSGSVGDFNPVMWTSPVFVCAEGGLTATTLNWIIDWLIAHIGESLIFPVMAEPCTPGPPLDPATCADPITTSGGQSYPVVGFVSLSVMGAWKGQEARDHCTFTVNNASLFCIQLRRDGVQVVPGIPGAGLFFNVKAVRLVD
jgi:hypothetical protein